MSNIVDLNEYRLKKKQEESQKEFNRDFMWLIPDSQAVFNKITFYPYEEKPDV